MITKLQWSKEVKGREEKRREKKQARKRSRRPATDKWDLMAQRKLNTTHNGTWRALRPSKS